MLSTSGIFPISLAYESSSIVSTISVAVTLNLLQSSGFFLRLAILLVALNDAGNGIHVTIVSFLNVCFWLLDSFRFLWKNSGVFPTHSVCIASRCLFKLFGFMLFAAEFCIQSKHRNLSFPSTSTFVNPEDVFYYCISRVQIYYYVPFLDLQ